MSTPYALYHNWLDKWLYCFKQNADYKAYCIAKEMGDAVTCEQFEAKYERIADLYADWGDIRNIVFRGQSETFKLWRGERSKLFLQLDMVRWIENPAEYEHRAGHALIEVPLFEKKNDTLASLEKHIDFVYKMRKRAVEDSSKESVRLIHGPLPQPKYTLHGQHVHSNNTINIDPLCAVSVSSVLHTTSPTLFVLIHESALNRS